MFKAFGAPEHEIRVQTLLDNTRFPEEKANLLLALYTAGIPIPTQKVEITPRN